MSVAENINSGKIQAVNIEKGDLDEMLQMVDALNRFEKFQSSFDTLNENAQQAGFWSTYIDLTFATPQARQITQFNRSHYFLFGLIEK